MRRHLNSKHLRIHHNEQGTFGVYRQLKCLCVCVQKKAEEYFERLKQEVRVYFICPLVRFFVCLLVYFLVSLVYLSPSLSLLFISLFIFLSLLCEALACLCCFVCMSPYLSLLSPLFFFLINFCCLLCLLFLLSLAVVSSIKLFLSPSLFLLSPPFASVPDFGCLLLPLLLLLLLPLLLLLLLLLLLRCLQAENAQPAGGLSGRVVTQPGQLVRYTLSKDDTNMFGLVQAVSAAGETVESSSRKTEDTANADPNKLPSRDALVTFYFRSPQALVR